jgi:Papain-like cysteine protease AvrRpt2.
MLELIFPRHRKFMISVAALFLCAVLMESTVIAASKELNVTKYSQEKTQWCWVTAVQSVVHFHTGTKHSQCDLWKMGKNQSTCLNEPGNFSEVERIFSQLSFSNDGVTSTGSISFSAVKSEIDSSRPFLIRLGWKSTDKKTGHMAVVTGYDDRSDYDFIKYIYINDAPTESVDRWNTPEYLEDNTNWSWTHTHKGIKY